MGTRYGTKTGLRRACIAIAAAALVAGAFATGCGIESREDRLARAEREASGIDEAAETEAAQPRFEWPETDAPRPVATVHVRGHGAIRIALYPELAPKTVENFVKLASEGFYDGTTFHRVIPGFMIQTGDPNTTDEDPTNDGMGGPGYKLDDEITAAPHVRGVVSMANTGVPNSAGSQYFIVHQDTPNLDGSYTVFGRVVEGLETVDAVAAVETDTAGRWGPQNRPLEKVEVERVEIGSVVVGKVGEAGDIEG